MSGCPAAAMQAAQSHAAHRLPDGQRAQIVQLLRVVANRK
jgi:hypothetical protein